MMNKNIFVFFGLIVILALVLARESYAQEFSAGIYPPIIQAATLPPTVIKPSITITNKTQSELALDIVLKPFRPSGKGDGSITYPTSTSLPEYLIFPNVKIFDKENQVASILLGPSESKNLTLQIDIDRDTPLSDYYFSVIFITNTENEENISIPAGIATNVVLSVGQNASKDIKIETFTTSKLSFSGPILFTVLLKNSGEHLITPSGSIEVKNMFGKTIDSINTLPEYILARSTRFLVEDSYASRSSEMTKLLEKKTGHNVVLFTKHFLMGKYEAKFKGTLLEDSAHTFSQTIVFYVFPIPYISAAVLILLITGIIFIKTTKKNRHKDL